MYKGELEGFPSEVVEKMLEYQVAQGNKRNVSVFENYKWVNSENGGFKHLSTPEGEGWWREVLTGNFNLFFQRYPKTASYPKVMMVSNSLINPDNPGKQRVVFMEKCGKFIAWNSVTTLEESERVTTTTDWDYAKDIESENPQKQELLQKAEELIKKAEELKEAANKL